MKNNRIEKHLYDKYNVKESSGYTGNLVGLTEISDTNSIMDEGDKIQLRDGLPGMTLMIRQKGYTMINASFYSVPICPVW